MFRRLALPAAATANAYSWLAENDPLLANHGEAADTWRAAVSTARQGPKFEVLVRMVATCADPTLGASRLVGRLGEALVASFPGPAGAAAPEDYGPALFAADLDRLREMRNRCVHRAGDGRKLAEQASQLVFAPDTGILASWAGRAGDVACLVTMGTVTNMADNPFLSAEHFRNVARRYLLKQRRMVEDIARSCEMLGRHEHPARPLRATSRPGSRRRCWSTRSRWQARTGTPLATGAAPAPASRCSCSPTPPCLRAHQATRRRTRSSS